jgi:hypothetical protein
MKRLVKKSFLIISMYLLIVLSLLLKQCLQVIYFLDKLLFYRTGMSWDALHASHPSPEFCFLFFWTAACIISGWDEQRNVVQMPKSQSSEDDAR